jgi:hypothetical protein
LQIGIGWFNICIEVMTSGILFVLDQVRIATTHAIRYVHTLIDSRKIE